MHASPGHRRTILLAAVAAVSLLQGCVIHGHHRLKRVWFDYNTLGGFALYCDEIDHLPYPVARVQHYRWMYGDWQHDTLVDEFKKERKPGADCLAAGTASASPPCEAETMPTPAVETPASVSPAFRPDLPPAGSPNLPPSPAPLEVPPFSEPSKGNRVPLTAPPPAPATEDESAPLPASEPSAFGKLWQRLQ